MPSFPVLLTITASPAYHAAKNTGEESLGLCALAADPNRAGLAATPGCRYRCCCRRWLSCIPALITERDVIAAGRVIEHRVDPNGGVLLARSVFQQRVDAGGGVQTYPCYWRSKPEIRPLY